MVVTLAPLACTASMVQLFTELPSTCDDAGAALAGVAADMGAGEAEMLAQELHQQGAVLDRAGHRLAVHRHGHGGHGCLSPLWLPSRLACRPIWRRARDGAAGLVRVSCATAARSSDPRGARSMRPAAPGKEIKRPAPRPPPAPDPDAAATADAARGGAGAGGGAGGCRFRLRRGRRRCRSAARGPPTMLGEAGEELVGHLARRRVDEARADLRELAADMRVDRVAQQRGVALVGRGAPWRRPWRSRPRRRCPRR